MDSVSDISLDNATQKKVNSIAAHPSAPNLLQMGPQKDKQLSSSQNFNQTKIKRSKINRSRIQRSNKVVAFEEICSLKFKRSGRKVAAFLEVPNSTMQSWREEKKAADSNEEEAFISTPVGAAWLNRIVMAAMKSNKCGPGGISGMQDFLHNSGLDKFVASSTGALQNFWDRCETYIIGFGEREEKKMSEGMNERKITLGLDEMFRAKRPCLVAMEAVSNYIFLEKFTENRKASTWEEELKNRLLGLNFKVRTVVSDLCGAITKATESIGATHSPDLFHGQQDVGNLNSRNT
jgi:hypothetical protein